MSKRRVVVTGLGVVSPVGTGVATAWENLIAGKSGITRITKFDPTEFSSQIAGEVKDFNVEDFIPAKDARRMDTFIQYGLAAGIEAFNDSGLVVTEENAERIGVEIGSGIGGIGMIESTNDNYDKGGPRKVSPFFIPGTIINMISGNLSIILGLKGPNVAIVTACTTGTHCIGDAARMIEYGDADVMVAGGAEAAITELSVAGFASARALSSRNDDPATASRPWDKDRDGFVIGEGAGVMVLEEYEHAKARGAKIYAEVAGYGLSADAFHMTAPNMDGPRRSMVNALKNSGANIEQVNFMNAHGTSTPLGDTNESNAIKATFGGHAHKLVINSTKSMTGHLLGGAGGLESVFTVLSIHNQISPPTINIFNQDPYCDLDYCANTARDMKIDYALKNNFGFGGTNGSLVFKKV
ncbi:MAG: beta-ketoacyl-ACP synthase II [Methylophilaceae bacterium]